MSTYNPAHPGETLNELLIEPLELSITDVAAHLNISRAALSKVLHGQSAIHPDLALRLELIFKKPSAEHWLRLQNAYDLWQARAHQAELQVRPYQVVCV